MFSAVTVTAGSTPPLVSVTRPTISAEPCAKTSVLNARSIVRAPPTDRIVCILPPQNIQRSGQDLASMRQNETHFGSVRLQPDLSEPDKTPPRPTTAAPPFPQRRWCDDVGRNANRKSG